MVGDPEHQWPCTPCGLQSAVAAGGRETDLPVLSSLHSDHNSGSSLTRLASSGTSSTSVNLLSVFLTMKCPVPGDPWTAAKTSSCSEQGSTNCHCSVRVVGSSQCRCSTPSLSASPCHCDQRLLVVRKQSDRSSQRGCWPLRSQEKRGSSSRSCCSLYSATESVQTSWQACSDGGGSPGIHLLLLL